MNLNELRHRKGYTAEEIAEKLGVSESCYRKYESSNRLPRASNIGLLKDIFDLSDSEIMELLEHHSKLWKEKHN